MRLLITLLISFLFAEFIGYFLHKLLHSEKVPWLSKSHMQHHLKDFGPMMKQRADSYKSGARDRINLVGLGLEWLIPTIGLIGVVSTLCLIMGMRFYTIPFILGMLGYSVVMHNLMHNAMHEKNHLLTKIPIVKTWFKKARKYHDIHHVRINDQGRMDTNYGISFFFMDRVFNTFKQTAGKFNEPGYKKALKRYKINET